MSDGKAIKYPGETATVSWHGRLCIHIGECGRAPGDLFVGGRKPWCQPDVAPDDEVEEVVLRCPTGALTYDFANGSRAETADTVNTVQVAYNGPLFVRGDLDIEGAPADAPGLKFRAALCRCGQSSNKPFCDNSHEKANFRDYGAVGKTGDVDAEADIVVVLFGVTNLRGTSKDESATTPLNTSPCSRSRTGLATRAIVQTNSVA